jgi:Na+/H+-dicarboxylate symporter
VVITLTTIGYGDLAPTTPMTKLITIFYGINGVILLLMFFDVIRTLRGWNVRDAAKAMKEKEGGWQTDT